MLIFVKMLSQIKSYYSSKALTFNQLRLRYHFFDLYFLEPEYFVNKSLVKERRLK